jgi:hypothetical protein
MTTIILAVVICWIAFSGFVVTILCMNSSRLSRIDEPFKSTSEVARQRRRRQTVEAQPTMAPLQLEV